MKILLQCKSLYSFHTLKIDFHTDTLPGLNKSMFQNNSGTTE